MTASPSRANAVIKAAVGGSLAEAIRSWHTRHENNMFTEKLQKVLARAGLGSRRKIEEWISAGRVSVNHHKATLGDRVNRRDLVRLDGRTIPTERLFPEQFEILCYHKPEGEITSRFDPEGRPTVFQALPRPRGGKWIAVGRLDFNTSGLLLFTTNGELANRLAHPSTELEREYAVRVIGEVSKETLQQLRDGMELEDGPARFEDIVEAGGEGANHWYHVVLKEGRNREVRRLWEAVGVTVSRLIRVRFGPITLPRQLHRGRFMPLEPQARKRLLDQVGFREQEAHQPAPDRRAMKHIHKPRRPQSPPRRERKPRRP